MKPERYENLELRAEPHVVILGAGASCAAAAEGAEKNGKSLPAMNQLPMILDLDDILVREELFKAEENFELFYDALVSSGDIERKEIIEDRLFSYFDSLELSDELTLYDKLVLSLRKKDLIATFNWDPLLGYAYRRNGSKLHTLPRLVFLHGNVLSGVCYEHKRLGWKDDVCDICKGEMEKVDLLYPVKNKDYVSDSVLKEYWLILESYLEFAYLITLFGYSSPFTDTEARKRIIQAIQKNKIREYLQLEIIDLNARALSEESMSEVIDGTHYTLLNNFENSWLSRHPRFTCEALFQATMMQNPIAPHSFPKEENLLEYQRWAYRLNQDFPEFLEEGFEGQG